MKIETYEQRILIPEQGHWLYNAEVQVFSDEVIEKEWENDGDIEN